jgi:1-deoxy-D-xylulose-5-phosphate synthase
VGELLDKIESPADVRKLSIEQLAKLAEELRGSIIDVVRRRGGHLASNLGIAELTVALHYVFDFAVDRLVWDVGHQCYAHKLITGRRDRFPTLRQRHGLSGFPDPAESPYDLFKVGHAGTAISTAVGLALADQALARPNKVVAVVGDASIVNGLSLEAINNAALLERQFLVVLNDNSMAIDVTQGAMAKILDRVRLTRTYADIKRAADQAIRRLPMGQGLGEALRHVREGLRSAMHGQQAFESLGFRYFGPVDGHDVDELVKVLRKVAALDRPALLHVHTVKGRGYDYAVEDPTTFHSPGSWTIESGKAVFPASDRPSWTSVFAEAVLRAARRDPRVCAITAAMPDGTGLTDFRREFPDRCFDVGICESHAVAMAAGLARAGLRPVVVVYSTFLQRAFDQVFQEVALQKLPVVLCMDRAGLVGADGPVHHGFLDIAYLRGMPGMTLMAPADAGELAAALDCALSLEGPAAIRYPRDQVPADLPGPCPPFEPGKARTILKGPDGTFLCYGSMTEAAQAASRLLADEGKNFGVVNARFAKPLDAESIAALFSQRRPLLVCEDHARAGGFGSAVLELAGDRGWPTQQVRLLGLPDRFVAHASRSEQMTEARLDPAGLAQAARELMAELAKADKSMMPKESKTWQKNAL